uniref:Uncharacterized protein n=1 Tax=Tanacetum cinerariifolium TaxID=118510 RepID=A0A6L2JAB0_TANCI|nr:hypothetical protein [Tanacetum cinerariifolium]
MNHQTSSILQFAYQSPQASTQPMIELSFVDSGLALPVFSPRDDPIACLNKAKDFLIVVASSGSLQPIINSELPLIRETKPPFKTAGSQCNKFRRGKGKVILNEDLDTYDSNCDDVSNAKAVLMANISNYGSDIISEVPHSETYINDMENQSVHAMQDFEQSSVVDSTDNDISSYSNIIPYSQYLQETQ